MTLTKDQDKRVRAMVKEGKFFPAIAKALKLKPFQLYQAYPGGARVLKGKKAYKARTAPTIRSTKVEAAKLAKKKVKLPASKPSKSSKRKSVEW